jgi:hypothetical protein
MWLKDYLQKRWGLLCLVGGTTIMSLWLLGGTPAGRERQPPGSGAPKPALKAKSAPPKKLTAASVKRYCSGRGVAATRQAKPQPQKVRHPGFPAARKSPPTLGPKARGLFPLRNRLLAVAVHGLGQAPLIHRLARGFARRYHYFRYLSQNRRAARRYYRRQAERRRKKGLAPKPGTVGPTVKAGPPPSSLIALTARGYLRNSLGYYRELMSTRTLARYKARPRALLEYASLVMAPRPLADARARRARANPTRRLHPKKKGAQTTPAARRRTEGLRILHRLLSDHPTSPEAIEAMALLAHQAASAGHCSKVVFMVKKLSVAPLPPATAARMALLRGLAHYHAGRCLLKQGSHGSAAKRLARAAADARQASSAGAKLGDPLAREAAIAWAQAYGAAGDLSDARAQLGRLGPKLLRVATGVLVAQLLKEGQLRVCMQLCSPPNKP